MAAKKGWYYLMVRNINNGCVSSDSVYVAEAEDLPLLVFDTPDTLTCIRTEINLRADLSNMQLRTGYEWSTLSGNIISDRFKQEISVNLPGWYFLKATDSTSLCSTIDSVLVFEDKAFPILEIQADGKITCLDTLVRLSVNPSVSESEFIWNWFTSQGNIIGSNSVSSTNVNRGGIYELILQAVSNGCIDTLSIMVQTDTIRPVVFAGDDVVLNCGERDVLLSGSVSAGFDDATIFWYSNDGEIIGRRDTLDVNILGAGAYILQVSPQNGCIVTDTVIVNTQSNGHVTFLLQTPECPGLPGKIIIQKIEQLQRPINIQITGEPGIYDEYDTISISPGTYLLRITDVLGCILDTSVTLPPGIPLNISLESVFQLELVEEREFIVEFTPSSTVIQQFNWSPALIVSIDQNLYRWKIPSIVEGTFQYEVITESGCILTGQIEVERKEVNNNAVYLPSAFTPWNRDGVNDYFYPQHAADITIKMEKFEIFTRWGERVFSNLDFSGNDPEQGWDGTFNDKLLNPGVYIWYLSYKLDSGQTYLLIGEVQLY